MSKRWKWECPHDWLNDKSQQKKDDVGWLLGTISQLADEMDHDQLQDIFQSEMDEDGYFTPLAPDPDCKDCRGTGWIDDGYRRPCLCAPWHGSNNTGEARFECPQCGREYSSYNTADMRSLADYGKCRDCHVEEQWEERNADD